MADILVVDDESGMRDLLGIVLKRCGYRARLASSGAEALRLAEEQAPDVVIQDLKMPGMSGFELLETLKRRDPALPVIVITAFATWDSTVEAMRLGAYDYIKKPFDTNDIAQVVRGALERRKLLTEVTERPEEQGLIDLVGNSPALRRVVEVVERVAATESTVLITGESGTGKELIARMCHYRSRRASKPFLAVNCGAFTESLLETELFGHLRGTFTGAVSDKKGLLKVADGGTFFLDEVGEMPLQTQVKLLRVLEERQFFPLGATKPERVDVRIVCATNRNLADEVRTGQFRQDLYYRLNVIPVQLPTLRDRKEDIPLLAGFFVRKYAKRLGRHVTSITPQAQRRLAEYDWPGNIRELENVIQRAIALAQGDRIDEVILPTDPVFRGSPMPGMGAARPAPTSLPLAPGDAADRVLPPEALDLPSSGLRLEARMEEIERAFLERAIARTEGNLTRAAELLGITFRSIRYKVQKLGLREGEREA